MSLKLPYPHPDLITGKWTDQALAENLQWLADHLVTIQTLDAAGQPAKLASGAGMPLSVVYTNQFVPAGGIILMRSGSTCPAGYVKVTAGIAGRYIKLTTTTAGTTGGSSSASVTDGGHTHGVGTYAVGSAGAHTHAVDPPSTASGGPSSTINVSTVMLTQAVASSTHTHTTDITSFVSASSGAHTHALSGASASGTTGITVTITPPFLEFILCEKS